jgi:hypothetical protein
MIKKIKNFRKEAIRKIAQIYANELVRKMKTEIDLEDKTNFLISFEQAAILNAYCVVFHDIYLD